MPLIAKNNYNETDEIFIFGKEEFKVINHTLDIINTQLNERKNLYCPYTSGLTPFYY